MSSKISEKAKTNFFTEFSNYLENFNRITNQNEKKAIKNADIKVRRLDSLARLINREQTLENCTAVTLFNNKWIFTANNFPAIDPNIRKIFKALNLIVTSQGKVISTQKARDYLLDNYLDNFPDMPKIYERLKKDVRKFLDSLKTYEVFSKGEIHNLLLLTPPKYSYHSNPKKLHAEVAILSTIAATTSRKKITEVTVGISKLCCKFCAAGVFSIKTQYKNLKITVRGRHGNIYFKWVPSRLLLGDCFPNFVGKNANKVFESSNYKTRKVILSILNDMDSNSSYLSQFFDPKRGAVNLNSTSAAPPSTESPTSTEDRLSDSDVIFVGPEEPEDSDCDETSEDTATDSDSETSEDTATDSDSIFTESD